MIDLSAVLAWVMLHTPCPAPYAAMEIIPRKEGWNRAGSLVRRLHNPGALKFIGQPGAVRSTAGFARFASDDDGFLALEQDLISKTERHVSFRHGWRYFRWK